VETLEATGHVDKTSDKLIPLLIIVIIFSKRQGSAHHQSALQQKRDQPFLGLHFSLCKFSSCSLTALSYPMDLF
jgi:hypothetical protein